MRERDGGERDGQRITPLDLAQKLFKKQKSASPTRIFGHLCRNFYYDLYFTVLHPIPTHTPKKAPQTQ